MNLNHGLLLGWVLWCGILAWGFLPVKPPVAFDDLPNETDKVLVAWVAVTGPSFEVMGPTSAANLRAQATAIDPTGLADVSLAGLELTGDVPWHYVTPAYGSITRWVLRGRIVGFTDDYRNSLGRRIPVFDVSACHPTTYVTNLFHRAGWFASLLTAYLFVAPLPLAISSGVWLLNRRKARTAGG